MGMDVYGKKPTSKAGEYFRNNVWFWHPLADFIIDNYSFAIPRIQKVSWHSNDGDGLGANDSARLADLLERDLGTTVAAREFAFREEMAKMPKKTCTACDGTGILKANQYRPQDEKCFACDGEKTVLDGFVYPFYVDNVKEFIAFLRDCGGFEIN